MNLNRILEVEKSVATMVRDLKEQIAKEIAETPLEGKNPDKYELTDYHGNKVSLNSLNGYQKGVVLNDCMAYFTGGEYHGDYNAPHGVIKIEEKEI